MVDGSEYGAIPVALLAHFFGKKRIKVWGIFNNRGEMVAYFLYKHESEAKEYARRWSAETSAEHYARPTDMLDRT
jgi:hypothetical protein